MPQSELIYGVVYPSTFSNEPVIGTHTKRGSDVIAQRISDVRVKGLRDVIVEGGSDVIVDGVVTS